MNVKLFIIAMLSGAALTAAVWNVAEPAHAGPPYGPSPESLTWQAPPDAILTLAPGQSAMLKAPVTDVDVWLGDYRLRQRADERSGGYCFTRAAGRRCLAGYVRVNRDLFNLTRKPLRVYVWEG